ncbi:33479_t:CDS:2 [Racocetra persica]|uniref:33479_t:CDS:1 n=1 Tax=Racocetra persica TaxID=160502 RepID=A0ACA9LF89_9GLOM|nr:33479_t:CDS:2 [Racocetra persica]
MLMCKESFNEEIDYVISSEESFNEEIDYEITNNYESPNEAEIYYEESFDELLNDEEIFDNEVLVDEVLNDEGPDKIVDEALSIEKIPSIRHWKLRSVKYSYKYPLEFAPLKIPEINFPIYKSYINLYYDDFGTYRNTYHSLGMKELEKGIIMDVQRNKSLVIASLGDVTANLPQGNDLARIKRHGALRGYRTCNVMRDFWTSNDLNLSMVSCYHHLTNSQFKKISSAPTLKRYKELATKYRLYLQPPILDRLKREKHL